jgi:hypothetical protein
MSLPSHEPPPAPVLFKLLPGPGRKGAATSYAYRNQEPDTPGCRMIWRVAGGRLTYQIALEQDDDGNLCFHCTCADAIYRAETEGRFCKHVRGLLEFSRLTAEAVERLEPRARLGA